MNAVPLYPSDAPRLIAHLDLKGVQFHPQGIFDYLENLAALGYDGLLVEYEDIFPYREIKVAIYPEEVWSPQFLSDFLERAKSLKIEIIPLQQMLGHLEYTFRWEDYRSHCIPIGFPSTLKIGSDESKAWAKGLLSEILEAHPDSRFVHLGMDEAYSLTQYATAQCKDPLELFLDYLDELCRFCQERGRVPMIWADMLEQHLRPENLERLRSIADRVILVPWNYMAGRSAARPPLAVRFHGNSTSRYWREHPEVEGGPSIAEGLHWFEDWPPEIQGLVSKYRSSPHELEPLFQAGVWKDLGFHVIGGCGAGISQDGPILPHFHWRMANIDRWVDCIRNWNLDGLVVTVWSRSATSTRPNALPDTSWPMLEYAAASFGTKPKAFFDGAPEQRVRAILYQIGRCRENWGIESSTLEEMEELLGMLGSHKTEWRLLSVLLETLLLRKRVDSLIAGIEAHRYGTRLMTSEWEKIATAMEECGNLLMSLKEKVITVVGKRYRGGALREWISEVFDAPKERLADITPLVIQGIAQAKRQFQSKKLRKTSRNSNLQNQVC
jgi:hypothetical protein